MGRTYRLKNEVFKDDRLGKCEPLARLLYLGMWTIADSQGRLEDRPLRIWARTLAYDRCDPEPLLEQLVAQGMIERYEVDGQYVIQLVDDRSRKPAKCKVGVPTVYFLDSGGLIKIGITTDIDLRLQQIGAASAAPLTVIGTMDGGFDVESAIHRQFAHLRTHGEWFKPAQELMDYIAAKATPWVTACVDGQR